MKLRLLVYLPLLLLISSCSDKVEPDITTDITGTYKYEESAAYADQEIIIQITKKNNTTVKLTCDQAITFKDEYAEEEPEKYHFVLDDIRLTDSQHFSFDKKTTLTNSQISGIASVKGTAVLSGSSLEIAMKITEDATGLSISSELGFEKQ